MRAQPSEPAGVPSFFFSMESTLDILKIHGILKMESKLSISGRRNDVKNRLEEIRRSRAVRQEELAAALEVSRQTISSLENGRYNPSILLAFRIASYFGMSIEDIFIFEEDAQ